MEGAIAAKTVTYDFARLMDKPTEVKCSEFGDAIINWMDKTLPAAGLKVEGQQSKAAKKTVKKAAPKKTSSKKSPKGKKAVKKVIKKVTPKKKSKKK
jgi:hypothetical protein